MSSPRIRCALSSVLWSAVAACGADDSSAMTGTTASEETSCPAGAWFCSCTAESTCVGSLVCVEGRCDEASLPAPGPAPAELPGPGLWQRVPSSDDPCLSDDDCPGVELCEDNACTHAWNLPWRITTATSEPLGCDPSVAPQLALLQVVHFVGGEFPAEVDYHGNFPPAPGCPFVWDGFVLELPPFAGERGLARVKLELREGDGTTRLVGRWCWDSLHNGACGPIPAEFLIAGELDAPELHVEFERITSQ